MEYELAVDNESEKELEICVPNDELNTFIEQEVDKLRKEVSLKGFRKGRAPKDLIRTKYQETIKTNALNDLVAKSYLTVLKEKKWRPASPAELLNIEQGEKIKFRIRLEIIPDFTVENYLGIEIFKEKPLPSDYLFEQAISRLREKYATLKEVSAPAVVDNFVTVDIEASEHNQIKQQETALTIRIGDRNFPDEINRALVGTKKGEIKEVKVGDLIYKLSINKIEERILPQVDDDFAQTLDYKNVEELRKKMLADLKKKEEQRNEEQLKESLANVILERIRFSVPKSLIQNEYQEILKANNLSDSATNKNQFWDIAEKRARLNLILDKITQKEGINTVDAEIVNSIDLTGMNLDNENQSKVINYFRTVLNRQKTIDFLLKNAKISEKSRIISIKEATDVNRSIRY